MHRLAAESGRYGSLVPLLGTVGLRWGEAAALRVSDVNFLKRRIVLHENAVAVGGRTHKGVLGRVPADFKTNVLGFSNIAPKLRVSNRVITADKSGQW